MVVEVCSSTTPAERDRDILFFCGPDSDLNRSIAMHFALG